MGCRNQPLETQVYKTRGEVCSTGGKVYGTRDEKYGTEVEVYWTRCRVSGSSWDGEERKKEGMENKETTGCNCCLYSVQDYLCYSNLKGVQGEDFAWNDSHFSEEAREIWLPNSRASIYVCRSSKISFTTSEIISNILEGIPKYYFIVSYISVCLPVCNVWEIVS